MNENKILSSCLHFLWRWYIQLPGVQKNQLCRNEEMVDKIHKASCRLTERPGMLTRL